jgi:GT2 family glycosyltransferase
MIYVSMPGCDTLTLLNSTWSNFVISDRTVDRLGGFDPGSTGIGFEDMGYLARARLAGVSISNVLCPYITHKNHQLKATSFDSVSDRVWGKYTSANQAYFFGQWQTCSADEGVFIKQIAAHVKPLHPLTPVTLLRTPPESTGRTIAIHPDRS